MWFPEAQIDTVRDVVPSPAVTRGRMYRVSSWTASMLADVKDRAFPWGSVRVEYVEPLFEPSITTVPPVPKVPETWTDRSEDPGFWKASPVSALARVQEATQARLGALGIGVIVSVVAKVS